MLRARNIAAAMLIVQLAWFAREQLGASRYFCWAPLHEHVWYRIDARLAGAQLSDAQVAARYGRRGAFYDPKRREFWELNAAQHVIDTVVWRERSLSPSARATVRVSYRSNDRETRTWHSTP